jgi:mRNA interferase MazF
MRRGDLYRLRRPGRDPKRVRSYVVVSRQAVIDSKFSSVICAPVFSQGEGLTTQIPVGVEEGLKHTSWIMCDQLVSAPKSQLTEYIGTLTPPTLSALNSALRIALDLP